MKRLTWKTANYFGVLLAMASAFIVVIGAILLVGALTGCVKVRKQTTIYITNPITVVDMQNGDSDKEIAK
jgi:hypothetical protein